MTKTDLIAHCAAVLSKGGKTFTAADLVNEVQTTWVQWRDHHILSQVERIVETGNLSRLAKHAQGMLMKAAHRYGYPFDEWEWPYCDAQCAECAERARCDGDYALQDGAYTAAFVMVTVTYLWQERTGRLPVPTWVEEAEIVEYWEQHPVPHVPVAGEVYVQGALL